MRQLSTLALTASLILSACGGEGNGTPGGGGAPTPTPSTSPTPGPSPTPTPTPTPSPTSTPTGLAVGASFQWQLQGMVNTSYDVAVYDIDLFDVGAATFQGLKSRGITVICYFSAGSWEDFRSDAGDFPSAVLGNDLDGWPGEKWLDIRAQSVRDIMEARLDLAQAKGCDGVEPDNVDGYTNSPGFPLTAGDQLDYNRFLATEAHARGLSIGLKNDLDQVAALVSQFDFAVNEQCHEYNECDLLMPFINAGKPVFNVEYKASYRTNTAAFDALCADAARRRFTTLVLPLDLDDSFRKACA